MTTSFLPTWIVQYDKRRPTLTAPLAAADRGEIEVSALDREAAAAAFRQRFPADHMIRSISPGSATGFAWRAAPTSKGIPPDVELSNWPGRRDLNPRGMDHDHWRAVAARLALLSAGDGEAARAAAGRIWRGTERAAGNGFPEKSPERTIFDTIPAKAKRTFKDVNMGFINSQSVCEE
jgi:hypothetical protein